MAKACRCGDGTRVQRACCWMFGKYLKAPMFSFCSSAYGGLRLPAYFFLIEVLIASSLPPGKTPCVSTAYLPPFSPSPHSSTPSFAQTTLSLSLLLSISSSLCPLRAAGLGRSLLRRSEQITCILDRRATWGHTLPEDRSNHAGGNIGTHRPGGSGRRLGLESGQGA